MEEQTSTHAPKVSELAKALAKAQGEFPAIPKDSKVVVKNKEGTRTLYEYMYADLTTIIAATRPALSKSGLSFTQTCVPGGFATKLLHESGETLVTGFVPFEMPKGVDMKTVGGLITYVKRISLTAALGVSADEDVDAAHDEQRAGNSTTKSSTGKASPPAKSPPAKADPSFISDAQIKRLYTIARGRGWIDDEIKAFLLSGGVKSSREIKKSDYDLIVKHFETEAPPDAPPPDYATAPDEGAR